MELKPKYNMVVYLCTSFLTTAVMVPSQDEKKKKKKTKHNIRWQMADVNMKTIKGEVYLVINSLFPTEFSRTIAVNFEVKSRVAACPANQSTCTRYPASLSGPVDN